MNSRRWVGVRFKKSITSVHFVVCRCIVVLPLGWLSVRLICCQLTVHLKYVQPFSSVSCWLGGRRGIWPVKLNGWVLAWLYLWLACIWPSWCHCHSLSLALVKSRFVVQDKEPLDGCWCWKDTSDENGCYDTAVDLFTGWMLFLTPNQQY